MKIFISWSGKLSHEVALALHEWLPLVINAVKPYVSSEDIAKGVDWFGNIHKNLSESRFGIVCVTRENMNRPWILFEAGAIASKLGSTHLTPLLIDLAPADIDNPLSKLQATKVEKDDFFKLVKTINDQLEARDLDDTRLRTSFEGWWSKLQEKIEAAKAQAKDSGENLPEAPRREDREILEEMLELLREISRSDRSRSIAGLFNRNQGRMTIGGHIKPRLGKVSLPKNRYTVAVDNLDDENKRIFLKLLEELSRVTFHGVSEDNKYLDLILEKEMDPDKMIELADFAGLLVTNVTKD
jgi:hypothetical protein